MPRSNLGQNVYRRIWAATFDSMMRSAFVADLRKA